MCSLAFKPNELKKGIKDKVRKVEGRGGKYMTQMKRNKNDKRRNGFWWLVVIMCTDFGDIHSVDTQPHGCFMRYV